MHRVQQLGKSLIIQPAPILLALKAALVDEMDEDFSGVALKSILVRKILSVLEEQDQHICTVRSLPFFFF